MNKDLLYSTGNYTQYSTCNGKESKKNIYIYIYIHTPTHTHIYLNHFALHLKLIQHCKSTIFL